MNTEIKKYADSGDLKSLKYIFVDSLDVDPTFARYEEEYNYCKAIPGLLEPHVELTPFEENAAAWNEEYWTRLKMDLIKNFSDRRMSHMREVAQVILADKVQRIHAECGAGISDQKAPAARAASIPAETPVYIGPKSEETRKKTSGSKAAAQARQLEKEKRKLEAENRAQAEIREREARERAARVEQQKQAEYQAGDRFPKKAIGIAVAAVAVAVVLFLLLK